jgi:hypothetical protein
MRYSAVLSALSTTIALALVLPSDAASFDEVRLMGPNCKDLIIPGLCNISGSHRKVKAWIWRIWM